KSRCVRQALGRKVCWISGQATPFGIYLQAYEHRHQPLVLDDVDGLYADRQGIRLLKALGQTEGTKTLSWQSAAPALAPHDLPRQFTTTSRVPGCPSVFPQQVSFNVCGRIARLPAVVRWTGVDAGPRGLAAACAGRASDRREPGRRESPGG